MNIEIGRRSKDGYNPLIRFVGQHMSRFVSQKSLAGLKIYLETIRFCFAFGNGSFAKKHKMQVYTGKDL